MTAASAASTSTAEDEEEEEEEEDYPNIDEESSRGLWRSRRKAPALVKKRVGDLAVVLVNPLGEESTDKLPELGDVVQFSDAASSVGHVIALSDLCFAAALTDPNAPVDVGDNYKILSKSLRPQVALPEEGGLLIDLLGEPFTAEERRRARGGRAEGEDGAEDGRESAHWFQDMVGIIRRQRIDAPLHAGVIGLDAFVPIGRGQSMLLRLPPGLSGNQLRQFQTHIVKAQAGNDVEIIAAAATEKEGRQFQELVGDAESASRLTVVSGKASEVKGIGEAVLAMNAACAVAEARRDAGQDALLLLDLEPLHRMWSILEEVARDEGLTEVANANQNKEIEGLSQELGVELWKYVARKNAATARRRTFLGCFLQRAGRMSQERGGGSMTLLAFARLKEESKLSRLELEARLKNLKQMNLDEDMRKRAVEKVEAELAAMPEDSDTFGVPDDFIEEAKAVTDGHVVFLDESSRDPEAPRWCVDVKESVARGITSFSVQSRQLHLLRSLNLKMYLMARESDNGVLDINEADLKLDNGPLLALMHQPVGDVLTPTDEAALLLLSMGEAARTAAFRPLAEDVLTLLARARVRLGDIEEQQELVSQATEWAAEFHGENPGVESLKDFGDDLPTVVDNLCDAIGLKPLERKRVLSAASGEAAEQEEGVKVELEAPDLKIKYASLRDRLEFLRSPQGAGELLAEIEEQGNLRDEEGDRALQESLLRLRERICSD